MTTKESKKRIQELEAEVKFLRGLVAANPIRVITVPTPAPILPPPPVGPGFQQPYIGDPIYPHQPQWSLPTVTCNNQNFERGFNN